MIDFDRPDPIGARPGVRFGRVFGKRLAPDEDRLYAPVSSFPAAPEVADPLSVSVDDPVVEPDEVADPLTRSVVASASVDRSYAVDCSVSVSPCV
ncbi:hypothetical protein [Gemmata massiliana]|uniref:hypothetical protein n=1 Tax=Gemmata massiliana TaxID=1210884 RepID=UPI0013A68E74|nr:hypothetical protein [Gemmata massiliana]